MGLETYNEKRDFASTPEPAGSVTEDFGRLRFVVQKHHASQLHYDLRLELTGALKSWAVPKGPSLNPNQRHLAVMVEDHPLGYISFEGVIPEGNYGAGAVMVWDQGDYCTEETCDRAAAESAMAAGLAKGHLSFVLRGQKLQGHFHLVRMKPGKEENAWLLFKADDKFAVDTDVTREDRSALSGRTMEEIRSSGQITAATIDLSDAPEGPMPSDVSPMLATSIDEPFDKPGWLFELKWDGYRMIAEVQHENVRLYSRNLISFNERFGSIVRSLSDAGLEAVLDGEVTVLDERGRSRFQLLQNYLRSREGNLVYYVFDILYLQGHDLRNLPLARRKEILRSALPQLPHVRLSDSIPDEGKAFLALSCREGLEGVVGKKGDSPYRSGMRTTDWVKIRCMHRQEFVVGGFTEGRGGRQHFGALALGVYDEDQLVYVGNAGSGLDDKALASIGGRLRELEVPGAPFRNAPKTSMPVHWVRPELVVEVEFHGWTGDGLLRQPIILGLREDKGPMEVTRENPEPTRAAVGKFARKPGGKTETETEVGGHALKLSNLEKVLWPRDGYTKGDLISYYREIAPFILPHLKDRPQSMNRHPDGIEGESFFQKNVTSDIVPDWVETIQIHSEGAGHGGSTNFLLCQDEAALVFMANMACIELHPWSSRVGSLDRPDYAVLDLDPLEVGFDAVVQAALSARDILEKAEIPSYPKTSGATGIHVYIPLEAQYTYDQARGFIEIIARMIHRAIPEITSVERSPARRRGRVYLDALQNVQGQTLASVYCLRPQPKAPVSMPLTWEDVGALRDPAEFNIRTARSRLDKLGDIFAPVLGQGVDLSKALDSLARLPGQ